MQWVRKFIRKEFLFETLVLISSTYFSMKSVFGTHCTQRCKFLVQVLLIFWKPNFVHRWRLRTLYASPRVFIQTTWRLRMLFIVYARIVSCKPSFLDTMKNTMCIHTNLMFRQAKRYPSNLGLLKLEGKCIASTSIWNSKHQRRPNKEVKSYSNATPKTAVETATSFYHWGKLRVQ